ncbi:MAG TPA: hypothetical protein PLF37_14270 [Planctomycetota bacterium]|nr:hypothetical protein [Planctomycetota bacterium]
MGIRESIVEHIELLSKASDQLTYESNVSIADIHGELVDGFTSDLYRPKNAEFLDAFTEAELKQLAHLYGLLLESIRLHVRSVTELLKQPEWRRVMKLAKELVVALGVRK